jgi:prevent-host-death family protein
MEISVTDAKAQLTELVRRAEEGDEVILTRHGQPTVRLIPVKKPHDPLARQKLFDEVQRLAAETMTPGPSAARSQDFLYGDDGLPE